VSGLECLLNLNVTFCLLIDCRLTCMFVVCLSVYVYVSVFVVFFHQSSITKQTGRGA